MTYYEHPASYSNIVFNWATIKTWVISGMGAIQDSSGNLHKLLRALGGELQTQYSSSGSTSLFEQYYQQTFQNFGYKRPSDLKVYDSTKIKGLIDYYNPVLLWGASSKTTSHVWVLDGLVFDYVEYRNSLGTTYSGAGTLFHCVWGWGSASNGYFKLDPGTTKYVQNSNGKWEEWPYEVTQYSKINYCGGFQPQ